MKGEGMRIKKSSGPLVTVAAEHWIEATCISRYLNLHGVPSAVHPAGPRRLEVRVGSRQEKKAKKLLSGRKRGNCGVIRDK